MNADFTAEELQFESEVREFLQNEFPADYRAKIDAGIRLSKDELVHWQKILYKKGWAAPNWPVEYGGTGWTATQKHIFATEMGLIGAPEPVPFGMKMVAPVIMAYGSEEQKQRFLPDILESNVWWCQGYSEPNSGSDLASLKTSAVRDGDDYIVNGSKTWNTYGQYADWIFCLVRTDTTVKHGGISFLLFDMHSPGVEVRPIKLISGASAFCETFFDNVKVPKSQLIGEVNGGWAIAKKLLGHERSMISQLGARGGGRLPAVEELARRYAGDADGRITDPALRDLLTRQLMNDRAFEFTSRRAIGGGDAAAGVASMLKYYGTEQNKRKLELLMKFAGTAGLAWEGDEFDDDDLALCRYWLRSKGNSIEGGTSEVQLNVIAKRVLGLPD